MSNIFTSATSRSRRVQLGQLLTGAVSRDVPEVMLATQIPMAGFSSQLPGPQIAPANPHNKLSSARLSGFAPGPVSHSMPIGAGVVRFSPIHF
jgi:hypothetical protein